MSERLQLALEIELRLARADDLEKLEWFGAFTHHRQIIREAFDLQSRGDGLMLLALANGFPVGQAWLDLRPRPGAEGPLVWAVRVMAPLQGRGLSRRLLARLEALARERGVPRLELGVETGNLAARAVYERLGWRVSRRLQESYSYVTPEGQAVTHALDEWVMVKDLGQAGGGSSPTRA